MKKQIIKPLLNIQKVLTWLCVIPADENTSKRKKIVYIVFPFIGFVFGFCGALASALFFFKIISFDLEMALFVPTYFFGFVMTTYGISFALMLRKEIRALFRQLDKIYETNAHVESFQILINVNTKCESMWPFYFKFIIGGFGLNTISTCFGSICLTFILHRNLDAKYFYRPYKLILPWNQQTLIGYFGEIFFVVISSEIFLVVHGVILLLFISMCLHHRAFYESLRHSVQNIGHFHDKHIQKHLLCELIEFHISVKNFFLDSSYVYSPFILIELVCNILGLVCGIFHLDLQLQHIDWNMVILLIGISNAILNLAIYCYFGKLATESFLNMADCLFESKWHELPIELQKYFIILIAHAQKPNYYNGFGIAVLNLETFLNCLKAVTTYFMTLKTLNF